LHIAYIPPEQCTQCGGGTFVKGLENLAYSAKLELQAIKRKQDNDYVKRSYKLKPRGGA
jgi:hypothetical protein